MEKNDRRVSKDRARRAGSIGASGQLPDTAASAALPLPTVAEDRPASPVVRDLVRFSGVDVPTLLLWG